MKAIFVSIIIFISLGNLFGESKKFKYRVYIPESFIFENGGSKGDTALVQYDTIIEGNDTLPPGTVIKYVGEYVSEKKSYEYTIMDTVPIDSVSRVVSTRKSKPMSLVNGCGSATISIDDKDKRKVNINYYLSSTRDRNNNYYVTLKNRQTMRLWFKTWEGGAITVPFKLRIPKNDSLDKELKAEVNLGSYIGFSFGQVRYRYVKHEKNEIETMWKVSVAPLLSLSKVAIDETNSSKASTGSYDAAVVSAGVGIMSTVYDFQFGLFYGREVAVGSAREDWNYHKGHWFGVGVGYNVIIY